MSLNTEQIRKLAQAQGKYLVSFYAPMRREGREARQNQFRWKTMLRAARLKLIQQGAQTSFAENLLRPATELIGKSSFWQQQSKGLACFLSRNGFVSFRVSIAFKQQVHVGDEFLVLPLLAAVEGVHKGCLSTDAEKVFAAARRGRIETLVLRDDFSSYGYLDNKGALKYVVGAADNNTNVNLANQIVIETLRNGGNAFSLPRDEMPFDAGIAAVFRPVVDSGSTDNFAGQLGSSS